MKAPSHLLRKPFAISLLLFAALILAPFDRIYSQQRSAYDLAAWIIAAVYDNDTTTINWALKEGGQIDFKRNGSNALDYAISRKNTAMVRFLLQKGASVDSVNVEGMNALQYAEKIGNAEVIQLISAKMKIKTPQVNEEQELKIVNTKDGKIPTIKSNTHKVGDTVLISRDRGKTWGPGIIKEINTKLFSKEGVTMYLAENMAKTAQDYLDINFITTLTRQASWTSFFIGDWDLYLPIAATERVVDRDVYQVISGGDKLPPVRINSDGTYTWVTDTKKVIKGKWRKNNNAPGLILSQGDRGVDWLLYNTSDSFNRKIYKTDYIILSPVTNFYTAKHGFRIVDNKK
jgi:hypothetical protein